MNLQINENTIKKCKEAEITIEEMIILQLIYNKEIELLNLYDENSKNTRIIIIYQKLFRLNLIKCSSSEEENLFEITEKSLKLIENDNI